MSRVLLFVWLALASLGATVEAIEVEAVKHYVDGNNRSTTQITLLHEGKSAMGGLVNLDGAPGGFTVENKKIETGTILYINHGMKLLANFHVVLDMDDGVETLNKRVPVFINNKIHNLNEANNGIVKLKSIAEIEKLKKQKVEKDIALRQKIIADQRIIEKQRIEANRQAALVKKQLEETKRLRLEQEAEIERMKMEARQREVERLSELKRKETALARKELEVREREDRLLKQLSLQMKSIKEGRSDSSVVSGNNHEQKNKTDGNFGLEHDTEWYPKPRKQISNVLRKIIESEGEK